MTRSIPRFTIIAGLAAACITVSSGMLAQGQAPAPPAPPASPRAAAPIDITGYWETIIVDDFRFRVTPQKGDIEYLPLNAEAEKVANSWDPDKDLATGQQCKAYGPVGLMQQPGRLHITWQDDTTLKLEADSGKQTRLFRFGAKPPAQFKPALQGYSVARWETPSGRGRGGAGNAGGRGGGRGPASGDLEVVTTNMLPGYIRKNGVPHSGNAVYTEYFHRLTAPNGQVYLVLTAIVNDPTYLTQPFIYTYTYLQVPDGSGWAPTPCWNK